MPHRMVVACPMPCPSLRVCHGHSESLLPFRDKAPSCRCRRYVMTLKLNCSSCPYLFIALSRCCRFEPNACSPPQHLVQHTSKGLLAPTQFDYRRRARQRSRLCLDASSDRRLGSSTTPSHSRQLACGTSLPLPLLMYGHVGILPAPACRCRHPGILPPLPVSYRHRLAAAGILVSYRRCRYPTGTGLPLPLLMYGPKKLYKCHVGTGLPLPVSCDTVSRDVLMRNKNLGLP